MGQPPVFLGPAEVDVRLRCAHVAQAERRRGDRLWRHRALGTKHVVALDVNSAEPEQSRARCPAGGAELKKQHRTVCQGPVQVAVRELGVAVSGWITARIPLDRDEVQLPVTNGADGERECGVVDQDVGDVPGVQPTWTCGRRARSGSASRSTSRVTGATSPWPKSRKRRKLRDRVALGPLEVDVRAAAGAVADVQQQRGERVGHRRSLQRSAPGSGRAAPRRARRSAVSKSDGSRDGDLDEDARRASVGQVVVGADLLQLLAVLGARRGCPARWRPAGSCGGRSRGGTAAAVSSRSTSVTRSSKARGAAGRASETSRMPAMKQAPIFTPSGRSTTLATVV